MEMPRLLPDSQANTLSWVDPRGLGCSLAEWDAGGWFGGSAPCPHGLGRTRTRTCTRAFCACASVARRSCSATPPQCSTPKRLSSPALGARWIHKALSSGCEWVGWFEREASVVLPFHGTTPGVSQCSDAQMQRPHNAQMDTSERCVSGASGHHNTTHLHKALAHGTPRVSTSGCKKYGQAHYRSWQQ